MWHAEVAGRGECGVTARGYGAWIRPVRAFLYLLSGFAGYLAAGDGVLSGGVRRSCAVRGLV